MSVRRPFTRGGRHLTLVRPRAPVPPSPLRQFLTLALRPATGVALVLRAEPDLARLALGLAVLSLLRGLLGGLWYYLMTGHASELFSLLGRTDGYTRYGGPLILLNLPAAHILWFAIALPLHLGCRLVGGQAHGLPALDAALAAPLPILAALSLYLGSALA